MYLLKRYKQDEIVTLKKTFTFHHVSIKTLFPLQIPLPEPYSHSTMYLLKQKKDTTIQAFKTIHIPPCIY